MTEQDSQLTRQLRLSSTVRGLVIAALMGFYFFVTNQPGTSFTLGLLFAAALQVGVLLLRRFVPPEVLPQAIHVFELLADAATILLFAMGVFGGMSRYGLEV